MRPLSAATIAIAVLSVFLANSHVGAKPSNPTPATATFRDLSTDQILSDGMGAYVDGVKNSVCHIFTGASEDLTIGTFQSGRRLQYFFTPAADVQQPTSNPPSGSLVDNSFVNIRDIGSMPIGSTKLTGASFQTAVGTFRWGTEFGGNAFGSQEVVVIRNSRTNWSVSTDAFLAGVGDLNVLLVSGHAGKLSAAGLYHMAFGIDVNCPNCP